MSETKDAIRDVMSEMSWWDAHTAAAEVTRLRYALAAAQQRIAELEEDAASLGWLSAQRWVEISNNDNGSCVDCDGVVQYEGRTLRAAIRAARSRKEG